MPKDAALDAFAREVNRPDVEIDLARAALLMGNFEYPDLDVPKYEAQLDRLADDAGPLLGDAEGRPLTLARYLFQELGFAGNQENYLDPRNSFLNQVIERRKGIPITLSILYLEVARRLGIAAAGVGLPGHFIVRAISGQRDNVVYLDPFHSGEVMTLQACRERVRSLTQGRLPFNESFLNPVGAHYILLRMLNNLKNAYAAANDLQRALRVVERLLALEPNNLDEVRNLGLLYSSLGQNRRALALLEHYLKVRPDAPDADTVRQYVAGLYAGMARWN